MWMRRRQMMVVLFLVLVEVSVLVVGVLGGYTQVRAARRVGPQLAGLHVSGNRLLNGGGQVVRPLGVDRAGAEYMCGSTGSSVFDGPSDSASVRAMLSWNINIVRVPLNEDCWLGINGYPVGYSSATYQQGVINYVSLLNSYNLGVILDLHWNAPGTQQSRGQQPMPDLDHAKAFWTSLATTFKSNSSVIFDLYNEPYPQNWHCWLQGSTAANTSPCDSIGFAVAGMQTLVDTVRATGATNVILLGGLTYSNDLSQWLQYRPSDSAHNLAASFHLYNFNNCNTATCWDAQVAPVAVQVPVIAGEMGENDCLYGFIDTAMNWFDQHNVGYLGWAWNTYGCGSFPALISSYDGTPTQFGVGLKNHLAVLASGAPTPTPGITPTPTNTASPTPTITPTPTTIPGQSCAITYSVPNQWPGGFTGNITISNASSTAIQGWTLAFAFPGNQQITSGWNGVFVQQGKQVSVQNASYNATIGGNSSISIGFNASWSGRNDSPTAFTLNGRQCQASTPPPSSSLTSCRVSYSVPNQWPGGFTGNITLTNTSASAIQGWTLTFAFPSNQQIASGWNGTFVQQGKQVNVQDAGYNATIEGGGSVSLGFNASWSGSNDGPTTFTVNGVTCSAINPQTRKMHSHLIPVSPINVK